MDETGDNTSGNKALHNHLVLKTIFEKMDAKDLQSCRQVCSQWEDVSKPYFAQRSKFFITGNENSEVLDIFTETFKDSSVTPITNVCFKGSFPANKFKDFFNSWSKITELHLQNIALIDTHGNIIDELILNELKSLNLKALSCKSVINNEGEHEQKTELVVRFSHIRSVKQLHLNGRCFVHFDHTISPEEVFIEGDVRTILDGKPSTKGSQIRFNDWIDLNNVRKMGVKTFSVYGDIIVDVTNSQRLKSLSHQSGKLLGLSPQTTIKELRMSSPCDLSLVPVHLEKLELYEDRNVFCTGEVNLPQLRHLFLATGQHLGQFQNCPKLNDLIVGYSGIWCIPAPVPLGVKRVFINLPQTLYQTHPDKKIYLEYFHMEFPFWAFPDAFEILETVYSQILVITFCWENRLFSKQSRCALRTSEISMAVMRIADIQFSRGGKFAVGGINWDEDCQHFLARVDRKSEFYLFAKGRGRGIDKKDFNNLIKIDSDFLN